MNEILGSNNSILNYIVVLLIYAGLYLAMRQAAPRIDPAFHRSFWVLLTLWAGGVFIANYLLYLAGTMSFLPWLNNFMHSFIWIGLGLGFLFGISYKKPFWEQFVLFAVYSFAVKLTENLLLGTWEFNHFFFIEGNLAYIMGWSIFDGLYPLGATVLLWAVSHFVSGVVVPKFSLLE